MALPVKMPEESVRRKIALTENEKYLKNDNGGISVNELIVSFYGRLGICCMYNVYRL